MPLEYPKTGQKPPHQSPLSVLVVIPTYNEADNVETITRAVLRQPAPADVLIVDDHSPDGTGALADALAASSEAQGRVQVLHRAGKEALARP